MNETCPNCCSTAVKETGTIGPGMAGFNDTLDVVVPEITHIATCSACGSKLRRRVAPDAEPPAWELADDAA
jgi:hypothetical protein